MTDEVEKVSGIPRMPDGSYMTPKDAIYHAGAITPDDIKGHSLLCNILCRRCNTYLPPHTTGRHYDPDDLVHKCPEHNREALESEAILLLGNARPFTEEGLFCESANSRPI